MADKKYDHQLQLQSQQIEQTLHHHAIPGRVEQAHRRANTAAFDVRATLATGWEKLQSLGRDLQQALGGLDIHIERADGRLRIELQQPYTPPVELLPLMHRLPDLPPATAVLGWMADEQPLLLNFEEEAADHLLIAGNAGSGKTGLMRTIAASLAVGSREAQLQMVVLMPASATAGEYEHSGLRPLAHLPHLLMPPVEHPDDMLETLSFLLDELHYRQTHHIHRPHIVVLVDHLLTLLNDTDGRALRPLTHLLRRGAKYGFHLVMSTRRPTDSRLRDLYDAYIPARVVGRVHTAEEAQTAADAVDSYAEYLPGDGAFVAAVGDLLCNFQAAYINDYDLHLCLRHLHQSQGPVLLARRFDPRPRLRPSPSPSAHHFYQYAGHHASPSSRTLKAGVDTADDSDVPPVDSEPAHTEDESFAQEEHTNAAPASTVKETHPKPSEKPAFDSTNIVGSQSAKAKPDIPIDDGRAIHQEKVTETAVPKLPPEPAVKAAPKPVPAESAVVAAPHNSDESKAPQATEKMDEHEEPSTEAEMPIFSVRSSYIPPVEPDEDDDPWLSGLMDVPESTPPTEKRRSAPPSPPVSTAASSSVSKPTPKPKPIKRPPRLSAPSPSPKAPSRPPAKPIPADKKMPANSAAAEPPPPVDEAETFELTYEPVDGWYAPDEDEAFIDLDAEPVDEPIDDVGQVPSADVETDTSDETSSSVPSTMDRNERLAQIGMQMVANMMKQQQKNGRSIRHRRAKRPSAPDTGDEQ